MLACPRIFLHLCLVNAARVAYISRSVPQTTPPSIGNRQEMKGHLNEAREE